MMDEQLGVKEGNRRNVFYIAKQRGQHDAEYQYDLDSHSPSLDGTVSLHAPPSCEIDRSKDEHDERELDDDVDHRERSYINR